MLPNDVFEQDHPPMNLEDADIRTRNSIISLVPYQEIIGKLERVHQNDNGMVIELSTGTLYFPSSSMEAKICDRQLRGQENSLVSILRTDDPENPLLIRTV